MRSKHVLSGGRRREKKRKKLGPFVFIHIKNWKEGDEGKNGRGKSGVVEEAAREGKKRSKITLFIWAVGG